MNDDQPTTPDLQFAGGGLFVKSLYAGQVAPERISRRHAAQIADLRGHNHPDASVRARSVGKKSTLRCNTLIDSIFRMW
jgi:hypothetical protein